MRTVLRLGLGVGVFLCALAAHADPIVFETTSTNGTKASLQLGGYIDSFYQWNFNNPSNGLTNFRGFDNRHNSFTIANAVLDFIGRVGPVSTEIIFQVGHTPETYYLAEPAQAGASGAAASSAAVWKYLQKAAGTLKIPLGRGIFIDGGILITPIGPESFAWKDNWNLSRSNLFYGCPFYHTGIKVYYPATDHWTVAIHMYNGWNSVVDNNAEKTLAFQATYDSPEKVNWNFVYMTGVERPTGAPEGRAWRHLFDTYVGYYPHKKVALSLNVDGGLEPNNFGTSYWAATAAYVKVTPLKWLRISVRGDYFYEHVAANAMGTAGSIFWPVKWVAEFTASLDFRPMEGASIRVEYRHDHAAGNMYFQGQVPTALDGTQLANARTQNTLTLGLTSWF